MIQVGSYLRVCDNTGAKDVCCVKVMKGYRKRYASIGDVVLVSVKSLRSKRRSKAKIQKGILTRALILRTKSKVISKDGTEMSFLNNSVVLLNRQNKPLGTRILGGVPKLIRYTRYMKVASMASGLLK